jgi:hypothetical protein
MLTETKKIKVFTVIFFALVSTLAQAQDSVHVKPFAQYWTKPRIVPKIGFGAQDSPFIEAGIQWHKIFVHPLTLASAGPYLTIDGLLKEPKPIYGPKIGYEITAGLFGFAADVTYYTDFNRKSVLLTPKAGLTLLGFADLFYGYNINLSEDRFKAISRNRFSLVFNINPDYFNVRAARRNPEKKDREK